MYAPTLVLTPAVARWFAEWGHRLIERGVEVPPEVAEAFTAVALVAYHYAQASTSVSASACPSDRLSGGTGEQTMARMPSSAAADRLGVTNRRVLQLIDSGTLDGQRQGGRWLITEASVAAAEKARAR